MTLTAAASDNVGVAKVEFYDGGILKGTDTASPYTYSWCFTGADNGTHSWTARAYDAADNLAISGPASLTVDIAMATNPGLIGFIPGVGYAMDVAVSGTNAFLASEAFGLSSINVFNPGDPMIAGSSDIPFYGMNVAVSGYRAVVTGKMPDGTAHLWVLDVTDATFPIVIGELSTTTAAFYDVAVNGTGTLAVVAAGTAGVWVVDLSNPAVPVVRGIYDTPGTAYGVALNSTATLAYVADGSAGLKILNISNPSAPSLTGSLTLTGKVLKDVVLSGTVAYVVNQQGTLDAINVSSAAVPQWMGLVQLSGFASRVAVEGTKAVVIVSTSTNDLLDVVNISNPSAMVRTGSVIIGAVGTGKGVAISNSLAYVAANGDGLKIYDLSLSLIGTINDEFLPQSIAVGGTRAVVIGKYKPTNMAHLEVLDVSSATLPNVVGELPTTTAAFYDVAVNGTGTLAVVAAGTAGVWVVDLSNPAVPVVRGIYDTPGTAYGVALNSTATLAYVADGSAGIKIVNISNPSAPSLAGSLTLTGKILKDVALLGSVAYVANQQGTLDAVNVSNAASPQWMGLVQLSGFASRVAVEGTKAVVIASTSTNDLLDVVNISNPSAMVRTGSVIIGAVGTGKGVAISNSLAYVAANGEGLKIYDVPTSGNPVLNTQMYTPGDAIDVSVIGSMAYIADYPATIDIMNLQ